MAQINFDETKVFGHYIFTFSELFDEKGTTALFKDLLLNEEAIKEEAERCGMFHVQNRWLGGTLTNFSTIRQSIERLRKLEEMENDPKIAEALTISVNTVRTHIKSIYGKLDVHSRGEAVERARELGLV